MNRGGAETMIMNYYRYIDTKLIQFDFLISAPEKCDYEDEILALGGKVFRVPILSKSPSQYLRAVNYFFKTHKEYKIVHSHTSAKNTVPLGIAKWNKVPVRICHSHNVRNEKGFSGIIKNMLKPFLKYVATDFIACGEDAGIWLYGSNYYKTHGILFRNVIDVSKFKFDLERRAAIRAQHNWDSKLVIGNVARFDTQKNHEFIVDIFNALHQKMSNTILLLIGDGPQKRGIEEKVTNLKLNESVVFKGVVDNVSGYIQAMDVFLLPSHYEGLPLTVIEAQASGLKCFVSEKVITRECDLTGLIRFISLDESPDQWSDHILSSIKYSRTDMSEQIIKSGYDAQTSSKFLQDFYLSKY